MKGERKIGTGWTFGSMQVNTQFEKYCLSFSGCSFVFGVKDIIVDVIRYWLAVTAVNPCEAGMYRRSDYRHARW